MMMERVGDRKNGRIVFDRPKPTAGCSASGRRRRIDYILPQCFLWFTYDII
jgi:hypothetical protein